MSHNFLHQVAGNRCHTNKFTRITQNTEILDSNVPLSGDVTEVEAGDFLFRLRATLLEGLITASSALLSKHKALVTVKVYRLQVLPRSQGYKVRR